MKPSLHFKSESGVIMLLLAIIVVVAFVAFVLIHAYEVRQSHPFGASATAKPDLSIYR